MRAARCPLFASLGMLAACAPSSITASALQGSLAGTFAQLYALQQAEQGHPRPGLPTLQTTASCRKGTPDTPQSGPGNDWSCQVSYLVDGPGTQVRALYTVNVNTDGCWSADGDGPASVNGARTFTSAGGELRRNPLYLVDGCLDAG